MSLKSDKRDEALLEDIAGYFDMLASDSEAFAARGWSKRENSTRAKVWREAAADVRSIKLVDPKTPAVDMGICRFCMGSGESGPDQVCGSCEGSGADRVDDEQTPPSAAQAVQP